VGPRNVEYGSFEANAAIWNSEPDLAATFQALQRANVNVYQYDTRGLKDSLDVMGGGIGMFADHTGGQTVTRTNDPLPRVPEMFAENNSYYMLGIEPAPPLPKGEMHPIKITLARPDLSVRARTGYFDLGAAPPLFKEKPPKEVASALDKAMEGTVPKSDIPMGLMVAPFAVASPNVATVAIVAGLDRPASLSERDTVEIAARAFDVKDALRGSKGVATAKLELTRRPQASGAVHYDVATRLDLPPGRYEIRLAMTSDVLRLSGSAFTTVIVPAFAKEPLSMSGVVLGRVPFSKARGRDPLNGLLPFTPTTSRTFSTSDRVAAYVRVYLAGGNMAKAASVVTRIRDRADRAVVEEKTTSLVDGATMTARMVEHRFDLPLSRLQPGEYLLSIEASTGQPAAARHVRFTVE
jgi:hypothetical protein